MTGAPYEWFVNHVAIAGGTRPSHTGESESCLRAVVAQKELTDERVWELRDILTFTFTSANLVEVGA